MNIRKITVILIKKLEKIQLITHSTKDKIQNIDLIIIRKYMNIYMSDPTISQDYYSRIFVTMTFIGFVFRKKTYLIKS